MKRSDKMTKVKDSEFVINGIGTDILQGTVVGTCLISVGIIGAWSFSCIISGIIEAGGIVPMITNWGIAITGM